MSGLEARREIAVEVEEDQLIASDLDLNLPLDLRPLASNLTLPEARREVGAVRR